MTISSPVFEDGGPIPSKYTCEGGNINPELAIFNVPSAAHSLVLVVEDPDSPKGDFAHWLVWNIDPNTELIKQESVPPGSIQGGNDFGVAGYGGPCPQHGKHHYHFRLYALNSGLDLPEGALKNELLSAMETHIIAETDLVGTYELNK